MCYTCSHGSGSKSHLAISLGGKTLSFRHTHTHMQRICELPPVIMVPLHNKVYSLDVWTLWSTVLRACSIAPSKPCIMQGRVQYLLPTQTERRFKRTLWAPLVDVLRPNTIAWWWSHTGYCKSPLRSLKSEAAREKEREHRERKRKGKKRERVPALMNH